MRGIVGRFLCLLVSSRAFAEIEHFVITEVCMDVKSVRRFCLQLHVFDIFT